MSEKTSHPSEGQSPLNRLAAVAEHNSHHYGPLPSADSIRVMEIQPGSGTQPVSFTLDTVDDYHTTASYHALSYCWGDTSDTIEIYCAGLPFLVTRNLHEGLSQLRSPDKILRLWVDAVCLNQHDVSERNHQVSLMKQIYEAAIQVDVWLGPSDMDDALATALINRIAVMCCLDVYGESSRDSWVELLKMSPNPLALIASTPRHCPGITKRDWLAMARFYARSCFSRVWIIREVQACGEVRVHCGDMVLEWEFVALTAAWAHTVTDLNLRGRLSNVTGAQSAYIMREKLSTHDAPFLTVLERARSFNSTDPRDKVFSMLQHEVTLDCKLSRRSSRHWSVPDIWQNAQCDGSPAETPLHLGIHVNYNLTTTELYREVAVRSIAQYGSLEVLCHAGLQQVHEFESPSWVPRWDLPGLFQIHITPLYIYKASADKRLECSFTGASSISIRGIIIDLVLDSDVSFAFGGDKVFGSFTSLDPVWTTHQDSLMSAARFLTRDVCLSFGSYPTRSRRAMEEPHQHFADFAAYLSTTTDDMRDNCYIPIQRYFCDECDQRIACTITSSKDRPARYTCSGCRGYTAQTYDVCRSCFTAGKQVCRSGHRLQYTPTVSLRYCHDESTAAILRKHAILGRPEAYADQLRARTWGEKYFSTSKGLIGIGKENLCAGDVVVVLYGSQVPFILRPRDDHYLLVGTCYVHGMMDGEAIAMCEAGELLEQDFELR